MNSTKIQLYSYFRSSAAYRVRIALNLKNIHYETIAVDLTKEGGENWKKQYLKINPQGFVPALHHNELLLTQSLAIIEYLEEKYPTPSISPMDISNRALSRAMAHLISCDIHPLNNLRILDYLRSELSCDKSTIDKWYCHWITQGCQAVEELLRDRSSEYRFCYGDAPSFADICLVPQLYNAKRFHCDTSQYHLIDTIVTNCNSLSAFQNAAPENQADVKH
ncbi:Maleylacetoacetate isomerase @ Glutathione S-transferase, zeta [hydrothermal vent metagenome]|uniref:Maleylacetoacetate isomerase @ Glutathione S-transferase, zeta n=1 Tax=hydrothermal vent metagenome TaxID=652676 RepID=A0A3B1A9Z0_9ZZZZ